MPDNARILVTGATGHQGGAVARQLAHRNFQVRALTRDPDKPAARMLAQEGIELVAGDLDDRASLDAALEGVRGVFSVQNFWETGYDREIAQGTTLADAAHDARVEHFVYSSVGSAHRETGLSHFDSKFAIEQHIRQINLPATILRPVFFMDNWQNPMLRDMILAGQLVQPLSPTTRLQQIDTEDIGVFATLAFENPDEWIGTELDIAGDQPTMEEAAQTFSRVIGREVVYQQAPWDDFQQIAGEEYALMYRWFEDVGYEADIAKLRQIHPKLTDLETFLRKHEWQNAPTPA